jgi:malonate-semialdehyde dehydrogenase (acetylating) / methylmalonate-semialdehyde dehydrogenase
MIDGSQYGNGASIFTQSGAAARAFQRRVSAGMTGVNVAIPVPASTYAVQGRKKSAFGDTGLNNQSWSFYTHAKYVAIHRGRVDGTDVGFRPN